MSPKKQKKQGGPAVAQKSKGQSPPKATRVTIEDVPEEPPVRQTKRGIRQRDESDEEGEIVSDEDEDELLRDPEEEFRGRKPITPSPPNKKRKPNTPRGMSAANKMPLHGRETPASPELEPTDRSKRRQLPLFQDRRLQDLRVGAGESRTGSADSKAAEIVSRSTGRRAKELRPWRKEDFVPGTIIWAPNHQTRLDQSETSQQQLESEDVNNFAKGNGGEISTKYRPAVVLWAYDDTLFIMPTTTRTSRGIPRGPYAREYTYIRESGTDYDTFDQTGNLYLPGLKAFMLTDEYLRENCLVRFTYTTTIHLQENIRIVGALGCKSTQWLIEKWKEFRDKAEDDGWAKENKKAVDRHDIERRDYGKHNDTLKDDASIIGSDDGEDRRGSGGGRPVAPFSTNGHPHRYPLPMERPYPPARAQSPRDNGYYRRQHHGPPNDRQDSTADPRYQTDQQDRYDGPSRDGPRESRYNDRPQYRNDPYPRAREERGRHDPRHHRDRSPDDYYRERSPEYRDRPRGPRRDYERSPSRDYYRDGSSRRRSPGYDEYHRRQGDRGESRRRLR